MISQPQRCLPSSVRQRRAGVARWQISILGVSLVVLAAFAADVGIGAAAGPPPERTAGLEAERQQLLREVMAGEQGRVRMADSRLLSDELRRMRDEVKRLRDQTQSQLEAIDTRLQELDRKLDRIIVTPRVSSEPPVASREAPAARPDSQRAADASPQLPPAPRFKKEPESSVPSDSAAATQAVRSREAPTGPATVCRDGCAFDDLGKAVDAAMPGDTVSVAPGLYGFCAVIRKPLRVVGMKGPNGERAHLGGGVCSGKGPLVATVPNIVIEGFEISNVSVRDQNGACIRVDAGATDVVIRDIYCHDSETGLLGGPRTGSITIEDSVFERNGNRGRAHGIYINNGDLFVLRNTRVLSSKSAAHSVKSGAQKTVIENSVIAALDGHNSRAIDFYGGGELVVRNSVIQQGANSENHDAVAIAMETKRLNPEPHRTVLEGNWIIFDDTNRCCRWLFNGRMFGPFEMKDNRIVGMTDINMPGLDSLGPGNSVFKNRSAAGLPAYDGKASSLPEPGSSG